MNRNSSAVHRCLIVRPARWWGDEGGGDTDEDEREADGDRGVRDRGTGVGRPGSLRPDPGGARKHSGYVVGGDRHRRRIYRRVRRLWRPRGLARQRGSPVPRTGMTISALLEEGPASPGPPHAVATAVPLAGSQNEKDPPEAGRPSTHMRPPCAVTIALRMARPKPLPPSFDRAVSPRTNRSKMCPASSGETPGPSSLTVHPAPPSCSHVVTRTFPPPGEKRIALLTRFITTCSIRARSPCTVALGPSVTIATCFGRASGDAPSLTVSVTSARSTGARRSSREPSSARASVSRFSTIDRMRSTSSCALSNASLAFVDRSA